MQEPLRAFLSYHGSKFRLAKLLPAPERSTIYEGFAGSAAYASQYHGHEVHLLDTYQTLTDVWSYLIKTNANRIFGLPATLQPGVDIRVQHPELLPVEHALIGFWLDRQNTGPSYTPSNWYNKYKDVKKCFWDHSRIRIAKQLQYVRHWTVQNADYTAVVDVTNATILLDPPYQWHGAGYRRSGVDYDELAELVRASHYSNQVICCEGEGARYLPFRLLKSYDRRSTYNTKRPDELVYVRPSRDRKPAIGHGINVETETTMAKQEQLKQVQFLRDIMPLDRVMHINTELGPKLQARYPHITDPDHRVRSIMGKHPKEFMRVVGTPGCFKRFAEPPKSKRPVAEPEPAARINKSKWIREQPAHLTAAQLVEVAKAEGFTLTEHHVYNIRSNDRRRAPAAPAQAATATKQQHTKAPEDRVLSGAERLNGLTFPAVLSMIAGEIGVSRAIYILQQSQL